MKEFTKADRKQRRNLSGYAVPMVQLQMYVFYTPRQPFLRCVQNWQDVSWRPRVANFAAL